MDSKSSKIKIIVILSLILSMLVFSLVWFYSFKSKQMILDNRISTLSFNLNYFKDLEYFNDMFDKIQNNSKILEGYVKNTFDLKKSGNKKYVLDYIDSLDSELKSIFKETQHAQGIWVQINPVFIDKDGLKAVAAWYINKNGICQKVKDKPRKLTQKEDIWYFAPVKSKKPVWSEVYLDPDIKVPMITYSVPVFNNNSLVGVVGIDVSLNGLDNLIKNIKEKYKNAEVLLIDSKQNVVSPYIINSKNPLKNTLNLYKDGSFKSFSLILNAQDKGFVIFTQNHVQKTAFFSHLPNNFSYILAIPNSDLLKCYNNYILFNIQASSILILIIVLILIKIIGKFLNPYQNMQKRLAYIIDHSWSEISVFDATTFKIIYLNSAALKNLGYTLNELKHVSVFKINNTFIESEFKEFLAPLTTSKKNLMFIEAERVRKNGTTYPIEAIIQYFKDETPPIFVSITRDISEYKKVEKIQNEFISTISHELRTPLTSIRGSLSLINNGVFGELPDEINDMLNVANNNCSRLITLINDILDFEKITTDKMDFKLSPVELMPVIEQAIKINTPYAQQYKVKFELVKSLQGKKVYIDEDRFIQVITNLLSNAAKFSGIDKSVEIAVFEHNNLIRISVTNYGLTISEEYKDRIFQKFTQVDSSDTRQKGGTGLGLSISKLIIEKLYGSIGFESRDSKTVFYIDLPEWTELSNFVK